MNLKNLNDMQKKMIKYIIIVIGAIILLFIILGIIKLIRGNKLSFEKIENKMVTAAEKYYKDNPHLLPENDISKANLDVEKLINKKYMKELEKYTEKDVTCTGKIVVLKSGSYYTFVPKLNCGGNYKTNDLITKITSKSNIVTTKDGLYQVNDEYIYRGEKLNNYVKFANKTWQILRITKDNEIRLIQTDYYDAVDWDNRYNASEKTSSGINNFSVSRIKDDLEKLYKGKNFSSTDKAKIIPKQLCIGKRKDDDKTVDGSTECKTLTEEYLSLGLLQANEYLIASLDTGCTDLNKTSCTNYNFLSNYDRSFWTITADSESTANVYYIDYVPQSFAARTYSTIKLVINISGEVNYTKGNGTLGNPYIID